MRAFSPDILGVNTRPVTQFELGKVDTENLNTAGLLISHSEIIRWHRPSLFVSSRVQSTRHWFVASCLTRPLSLNRPRRSAARNPLRCVKSAPCIGSDRPEPETQEYRSTTRNVVHRCTASSRHRLEIPEGWARVVVPGGWPRAWHGRRCPKRCRSPAEGHRLDQAATQSK